MREFQYQIPDWHSADEWRNIKAHDAEDAAERAGDRYDSDGDQMLSRDENNNVVVLVKDASGAVTRWTVSAYHSVNYIAHEISADAEA